jgi:replicative DNA helicase
VQTLQRALRQSEGIGEPLPVVFPTMERKGWILRRAQQVMIAAAPNVGKSALALHLAISLREPTLYVSADTDPYTTILRSLAMITGHSMRAIEAAMQGGGAAYYEEALKELDYLRFVFDPAPSLEDIDLEVSAFNEIYGEPPALIVVDNLINVQCDDADEFRGLRLVSAAMHQLARSTGACVITLHHVTGEFEDGTEPPPRRALHGKISKYPEVIITLGKQGTWLGMACVKNRNGPHDPLANNAVHYYIDLDHMYIEDPTERNHEPGQ